MATSWLRWDFFLYCLLGLILPSGHLWYCTKMQGIWHVALVPHCWPYALRKSCSSRRQGWIFSVWICGKVFGKLRSLSSFIDCVFITQLHRKFFWFFPHEISWNKPRLQQSGRAEEPSAAISTAAPAAAATAACALIITTITTITTLMGTHLAAAAAVSLSQWEVPSESMAAPISSERHAAGPLGELLSFLYLFLYLFFLHQINCQGQATKPHFVRLLLPSLCR